MKIVNKDNKEESNIKDIHSDRKLWSIKHYKISFFDEINNEIKEVLQSGNRDEFVSDSVQARSIHKSVLNTMKEERDRPSGGHTYHIHIDGLLSHDACVSWCGKPNIHSWIPYLTNQTNKLTKAAAFNVTVNEDSFTTHFTFTSAPPPLFSQLTVQL